MTESEALGKLPAFARQVNAPAAVHANVAVACHALQGGRHRRRRYIQFFGQARADGRLIFLKHLPDGFEVIFLRYACLLTPQNSSPQTSITHEVLALAPFAMLPCSSVSRSIPQHADGLLRRYPDTYRDR